MKTQRKLIPILTVCILLFGLLVSCAPMHTAPSWSDAMYTEDTVFGSGSKTVTVDVVMGENSVTFTLKTDETYLGDALLAHDLIEGKEQSAGFYVTKVNGIAAIWEDDRTYWAFYKSGEYMMTGVGETEIQDGEQFELVRTQG